jgi:EAL domain-containing protein (putative c-di-GMP-specific phosphodiesterase class I)
MVDLGRHIRSISSEPLPRAPAETLLFVNLHTEELADDALYDPESTLSQVAKRVVLEITERAKLEQVENVRTQIARLREMGYRIAIDDIGAGYAGLTSFAILEPDFVKLDMSLIRNVDQSRIKQKLIASFSSLCKELEIELIAEGVETEQEKETLVELGCDLFQGYLFARPGEPFVEPKF